MQHLANPGRRADLVVSLIAMLSLPLFVYGLGATYLWQDEAQTALLGRSVLAHGVPMVGDGFESLSAVGGRDAGVGGVYFQIAWLQAYVAAGSFRMLGESSWSARLPFALAGWLCVPLAAWTLRKADASPSAARIAALLTALSVPFIISSRQARYYALTAAITLLTTGTYAEIYGRAKRGDAQRALSSLSFGAAASFLVFAFDVTALGVLGALALHWVLTTRAGSGRASAAFWIPWTASCLLLGAWLALSFTAASRHEHAGFGTLPARVRHGTFFYLGQINAHMVPLPILLTVATLWRRPGGRAAALLAAVALGGVAGASLSPVRYFRYVVPVFPVVLCLASLGLASLASFGRWGKVVTWVTVVALISSTAPFVWSHVALSALARSSGAVTVRDRPMEHRIPLALLVQEFLDPPRGPIAAMAEYLRRHANAEDVLVATYGDLPLKFHTSLEIYGGETGQLPPPGVRTHWIWPRYPKVYAEIRPAAEWVQGTLAGGGYRSIELPVADRWWENREDPELHIFSNPGPAGPPVVIYRAVD